MTSSLVGSEMCIRDRAVRLHPPGALVGAAAAPMSVAPWRCSGPVLPKAVSYTHLTLPTICSV
eukprot:2574806-Prorocentrum_lima.AAC.1